MQDYKDLFRGPENIIKINNSNDFALSLVLYRYEFTYIFSASHPVHGLPGSQLGPLIND